MNKQDLERNRLQYKTYNTYRYNYLMRSSTKEQQDAMKIIPLLFHLNSSYLPGYSGKSAPYGVKKFEILDDHVNLAKNLNNKFSEDNIEESTESIIEAIYFQECFKTGDLLLWVIYDIGLNNESVKLLNKKTISITKWLKRNGINVKSYITNHQNISNTYYDSMKNDFHIDKCFFLDEFYAQSILIAGKAPLWWVVDNSSVIEKSIEQGSANSENYIDFSGNGNLRPSDYYSAGIWYMLNLSDFAMTTWIDLLLLDYRMKCKTESSSYAVHLKNVVKSGYFNCIAVDPRSLYALYINNVFEEIVKNHKKMIDDVFVNVLCHYYCEGKVLSAQKTVFDYLKLIRINKMQCVLDSNLEIDDYISSVETLYKLTEYGFSSLQKTIKSIDSGIFERIQELSPISDRFLLKLKRSSSNLGILKNTDNNNFTQEKVIILCNEKKAIDKWQLLIPVADDKAKVIKSFNSVMDLIFWCYLNNIIDTSTQISAHCPDNCIGPIEIINVIKLLSETVDLSAMSTTHFNAYVSDAIPVKSVIFVDMSGDMKNNSSAMINQLIIFNNGEFQTFKYTGYDNFIACIHNWFNLISETAPDIKPEVKIFGIRSGKTQQLKTSVNSLLHDLNEYFKVNPLKNTRTILKKNNKYYMSHIKESENDSYAFLSEEEMYNHLEKPLTSYTKTVFIESFDIEPMLTYLFSQNKQKVIQLFYYIENKHVKSFVFDENGALFTHNQPLIKRQSFINHWILFLKNMKQKYAIDVSVEINQLLKMDDYTYEHALLKGNLLPSDNSFYALDLKVISIDDKKELTFTCNNKTFTSTGSGSSLYSEISKFISLDNPVNNEFPFYVSNVDIPDSFEGMQDGFCLIDYLKYKRNIENRLNEKVSALL